MAKPPRIAITDATMERASRALSALRPDTCLVKRPVSITDAIGAPLSGVYDTVEHFDCRIEESPGGVLRVLGPVLAGVSSAAIVGPLGADVRDQDLIEVARTGLRYKVSGVGRGSSIQFETVAGATIAQ